MRLFIASNTNVYTMHHIVLFNHSLISAPSVQIFIELYMFQLTKRAGRENAEAQIVHSEELQVHTRTASLGLGLRNFKEGSLLVAAIHREHSMLCR